MSRLSSPHVVANHLALLLLLLLLLESRTRVCRGQPAGAGAGEGVRIRVNYGGQMVTDGERLQVSDTPVPPIMFVDAGREGINGQTSYVVTMIDRRASRQPGTEQLTYVHYWAVVLAQGMSQPARVDTVIAPYVRPAPHDSLEHPYQFYVFDITPATTSPPSAFLFDRFVQDFDSLVQHQPPLASTFFTEQINFSPPS